MALLNTFKNTFRRVAAPVARKTGINLPGNISGYTSPKPKVLGKTTRSPLTGGQSLQNQSVGTPGSYRPPVARQSTGLQNLATGPGPTQSGGDSGDSGLYEPTPERQSIDIDALINPVLESLSQTEAEAQTLFGQQEGNIEAQRGTSLNRLGQTQKTQEGMLDASGVRQTTEGETAADEARRQFAEIQQGIQGLYGGTTGTGAFAAELAGRDTLGRIANIRQGVTSALQEIDNKKVQIQELGRIAAEDIENDTRMQKSQAQEQLNSTLAGIRAQRGELASRKAELALQAMQNYQSLVADVNARNASFKQNLYLQQQAAEQRLAEAESRAKGIAESFKVANMKQGDQFTPVMYGNRGTVKDFSGNQITNPGPFYGVGGALPDEEEIIPGVGGGSFIDR